MISTQFKRALVLLFLGFLCGVILMSPFRGCGNGSRDPVPGTAITSIKAKAAVTEKYYRTENAKLDSINRHLRTELKTRSNSLAQAKQKVTQRKESIAKLIAPKGFPAKQLLEKTTSPPEVAVQVPCDSLIKEVNNYTSETERKDSLYEKQISTLDSVVVTQDAIIKNHSVAYRDIKGLLDQTLDHSTALQKDNWQLQKKIKRQKRKHRWAAIGLLLLSGAATHFISNH